MGISAVGKAINFLHQLFKLEDLLIGAVFVFIAAMFAIGELPHSDFPRLFIAILFCVFGLASMNSLNQIFDAEIDKVNKPHRPIPSGKLTKKQVLMISFALSAIAGLFTLFLGMVYLLIAVIGLLIGLIYSLPQIYAKSHPVLSTAVIGIGYGILTFIVGWAVYRPIHRIPIWLLIFLYVHEVIIVFSKDFSDVDGDKDAGVKTIPVILGKKRAAVLCFILYLIPFLFLLLLKWMDIVDLYLYPTLLTGIIFGALVFGFSGFGEKKFNYLGYSFYVVGTITVRIVLLIAFVR